MPRKLTKRQAQKRRLNRKKKVYRDVKSFKLQGKTGLIYSTANNVSAVGGGLGIANLTTTNNRSTFTGVYVSTIGSTLQWGNLQTMFDRYKIHGVRLKFIPEWNIVDIQGQAVMPVIKIIHDYDDSIINDTQNSPASIWARQGRTYQLNGKPFSVYIRPKVQNGLDNGVNGVSPCNPMKAPYINSAYPSIPHYALKFAVRDWYTISANTANIRMRIEPTYFVSFREQIYPGAVDTVIALNENGEEVAVENEVFSNPEQGEELPCENKP